MKNISLLISSKNNEVYQKTLLYMKENTFKERLENVDLYANYLHKIVESLKQIDDEIDQFVEKVKLIDQKWKNLSHRNGVQPLRILLNANFDQKGALVFSWSPYFVNQNDISTCNNLIKHHLGRSGTSLRILAIKSFSIFLIQLREQQDEAKNNDFMMGRNLLWSISILQKILCEILSEYVETSTHNKIMFNYKGEVELKDEQATNYVEYINWTEGFEANFSLPLSNFLYLANYFHGNSQKIRDFIKINCLREMSYAEVSNNIKTLREIEDYNSSIWRRSQKVVLPTPKEPTKQVANNKILVKKQGKKPRVSPVALRGNEGSQSVSVDDLYTAISNKIKNEVYNWHFTAGDFSEFVDVTERKKIVSVLTKMRKMEDIHSVYKGIYTKSLEHRDSILALEAYTLDRGEKIVSSSERALAEIGIQGNPLSPPLSFFTDGPLRKFKCLEDNLRLMQEPFPGLCKIALSCKKPNAFIATVEVLNKNKVSIDFLKQNLEQLDSLYEFELAQKFIGRFF